MPKKAQPQAKPKRQTTKKEPAKLKKQVVPKEQAQKILAKVPEEYIFLCSDGNTFRDIKELADSLMVMSDDVFARHVNSEKNDFYNWVRDVIRDEELAQELLIAATRLQTADCLSTRIALLTDCLI